MADRRIAVIADVHGNIWALDAVARDMERRKPDAIINLGDCAYGPLAPRATMDLLIGLRAATVRGNQDRAMVDAPPSPHPTQRYTIDAMSAEHLDWIRKLPVTTVVEDNLLLCHGTPSSDEVYLTEGMSSHGSYLNDPASMELELRNTPSPVVLCGHSHISRHICLQDGHLVLNPGSVGLPAYSDDLPHPHKMESGSPHARYALLTGSGEDWAVEQIAVPYDWGKASQTASRNGRDDWA